MWTENEKKVLRFLFANFNSEFSINEIAKQCSLSPNGAFKILKKLEKENILKPKKISNIKAYKLNFSKPKTIKTLELILMDESRNPKISYRHEDLNPLKEYSDLCMIFGSYARGKEKPNDLDTLFIIKEKNYKKFHEALEKVKRTLPIKIHEVIQTEKDLIKKLKNNEEIMNEILNEGIVLWGQEAIVKVISDVHKR